MSVDEILCDLFCDCLDHLVSNKALDFGVLLKLRSVATVKDRGKKRIVGDVWPAVLGACTDPPYRMQLAPLFTVSASTMAVPSKRKSIDSRSSISAQI